MKTFLIRSAIDDIETIWLVNAKTEKEAISYVRNDKDFCIDEDILSCHEINNRLPGVGFIACCDAINNCVHSNKKNFTALIR